MDQARGERCEGVKKEGCIKKQNTRLNFYVINLIIGRDLQLKQFETKKKCRGLLNFWHIVKFMPVERFETVT